MKIGILTFPHTSNYGAVLQAYALCTVLGSKGVEAELIDYRCPEIAAKHEPRFAFQKKGLIKKLASPITFLIYQKRLNGFLEFENKYLKFSKKRYEGSAALSMMDSYDRIVVGSDQVWNVELTKGDFTFFLDSSKDDGKKYSYAASIGTSYFPAEMRERCEKLLKSFQVISVRERSCAETLSKQIGCIVRNDLDPTLLIPSKQWKTFISDKNVSKDYLFVYMVPNDKENMRNLRRLAKKTGCRILWLTKGIKEKRVDVKILNTITPEEFINYVFHAKYIVTGSFHCTCFSILFEKSFFYVTSKKAERTVRLTDLLESLGIKNRELNREFDPNSEIDYIEVRKRLEMLRANSMKTIDMICKENEL